jgi:hypothetical protein
MELTTSNLISLAAMVAAIIGSAAVAKYKINGLLERVESLIKSKTEMDGRLDLIEQSNGLFKHRLDIVSSILSPEKLEKDTRELATIRSEMDHLKKVVAKANKT